MKSVKISIIMFSVMLVGIFFSLNYLSKCCEEIEYTAKKLESSIINEQWDITYENSVMLLDNWKKESKIIVAFVNHMEVEILNNEMLKLTQYAKEKNKDESLASVHVIKFYLNNIKDLQKINLQNLL